MISGHRGNLMFLTSAASKTQIYFQQINILMMLLYIHIFIYAIIMTMVMMTMISAMIIITKYSMPTIDFATRYSTRYRLNNQQHNFGENWYFPEFCENVLIC